MPVLHRDDIVQTSSLLISLQKGHRMLVPFPPYSCPWASPGNMYNCVWAYGGTWDTCTPRWRIPFFQTAPRASWRRANWSVCATCHAQHSLSIKQICQSAVPTRHSSCTETYSWAFPNIFPRALLLRTSKVSCSIFVELVGAESDTSLWTCHASLSHCTFLETPWLCDCSTSAHSAQCTPMCWDARAFQNLSDLRAVGSLANNHDTDALCVSRTSPLQSGKPSSRTCNPGHPYDYYSSRSKQPLKGFFVLHTRLGPRILVQLLHWPLASPPTRLPLCPWPNQWHSNPTYLEHQTPTTSWSQVLPPKNLKHNYDSATGSAGAWPNCSRHLCPGYLSICNVFMDARFAPFFVGFGINKLKLTRPFLCRPLWKIRYSDVGIWSVIQGHQASHNEPLLHEAAWLRDLLRRYKTSSREYKSSSSSWYRRSVLGIPNRGVLLLLLVSCDVRLYTTVATLSTSPRTFFFFGDPVRRVCWYSCTCAGLTTGCSSLRSPRSTPGSVFTP